MYSSAVSTPFSGIALPRKLGSVGEQLPRSVDLAALQNAHVLASHCTETVSSASAAKSTPVYPPPPRAVST
ncbi:MAG: hypothetical protein LBU32_05665 [Clostridiales bacterium]|nr:hypothetical protein [Clostridiales bacterium]